MGQIDRISCMGPSAQGPKGKEATMEALTPLKFKSKIKGPNFWIGHDLPEFEQQGCPSKHDC